MKKWFKEDYCFKITVLSIKPDNKTENHCRNGHEVGDMFTCEYGCPDGFYGSDIHIMEFDCPDVAKDFAWRRLKMQNKGLMIINNNTPCSCACRYCFFRSCKKADGIEYFRGEKIALKFNQWRKSKALNDFFLSYTIGYCADYPQLVDNIKLNQSFDFIGAKFLQINGIGIKNDIELRNYLESVKNAGVTKVDTTFYGLSDYHDCFASRNGDIDYLLKIVQTVRELGMAIQPTIAIFEDNKEQIAELLNILDKYMSDDSKVSVFLQDYRGNGENLENIRLTKSSYETLPDNVKKLINISRYKTEQEWLQLNEWHKQTEILCCL